MGSDCRCFRAVFNHTRKPGRVDQGSHAPPIKSPAEELVDEIVEDVREAIWKKMAEVTTGSTFSRDNVLSAGYMLFWERRWPGDIIDLFIE